MDRWKRALLLVPQVHHACGIPKRIVLKSPPHTCRIRALLEMFPKAKFVHIVRDPYVIFPSTVNLWKRLYRDEGLQVPTYEGLDEHVFKTLHADVRRVRPRPRACSGRASSARSATKTWSPTRWARCGRSTNDWSLGDFEAVRPAIEDYFAGQKDYKTNRYQITPELRPEITRRWGKYIEHYGYTAEAGKSGPAAVDGRASNVA